jgi:hypothetical protein
LGSRIYFLLPNSLVSIPDFGLWLSQPKYSTKTKFDSKTIVAVLSMGWFLMASVWAQTNQSASNSHLEKIPATEAKNHIGETATVYGTIYHAVNLTGAVGFDVDGYYPNQPFNIIVRIGRSRGSLEKFVRLKGLNSSLSEFEGKEISVTGMIGKEMYSGIPRIIANSADEIMVQGQLPAQVPDFATLRPVSPQPVSLSGTNATIKPWERYQKPSTPAPTWSDTDATNTIITVLGHVYHHAKVTLVEPDGLTIKYTPDSGGFGGIKIPFGDLPLENQQQYGYDPQQAAAYVEAKGKKEEQQKQAAQQAEAKQAQQDYEQAKADYEQAKEEFDAEIKIQTLQAQQQIADAQSKTAQQAALQTRIMRAAAIERQIQEQQKLWEMQSQTYQQQRIADQINDLNWQLRMIMLNR